MKSVIRHDEKYNPYFSHQKKEKNLSAYIQISLNSHATNTFDKGQAQDWLSGYWIHPPFVMRWVLGTISIFRLRQA